jgi:outer membrane biosynthesis protein TonB
MVSTLLMATALMLAAPPVDAGAPGELRGDQVGEAQGFVAVDTGKATGPEARVRIDRPEVEGPLDVEVARRVLAMNRAQLRYCYERAMKDDPTLQGRLTLSLKVEPSGAVTAAEVADSTLSANPILEACVTTRAKRWRFPTFPGTRQAGIRAVLRFTLDD